MLSLSDRQFDDMASDILMSTWKFYPDWASKEGLHEYDGGMTDVSPASIAARVRDVETRLALLHRLDPDDLSAERRFDRGVLLSALRQEKFILAELGIYRRNPMHVLHHIDVSRYVLREYAPPDERGAALTEALENVPEYVSALQSSLDSDIGAPIAAASLEAYEGMRTFYDTELATLAARMVDRSMFERFDHARRAASRALESFAARLRSLLHTSSPDFAIGSTNFRWLLEYGEMVDLPIDYLERIGEDDLRRNLIRLRKLAAEMRPDGDVAGLLRETRMNHPAASMLTAETRATVEDVRGFVEGPRAGFDSLVRSVHSRGRACVHALGVCNHRPAGRLRGGRRRGAVLCHAGGRFVDGRSERRVVVQLQLSAPASHGDSRNLSRPLSPVPALEGCVVQAERSVCLAFVHGWVGTLRRGDDDRTGLRRRRQARSSDATDECVVVRLQVLVRDVDAHSGDVH